MTWLSRICFSGLLIFGGNIPGAPVSGRVKLKDSGDPAVRGKMVYSGVVVYLKPAGTVSPPSSPANHARMLQKDKTFIPHILPIEVGSWVDFPNQDPIFHNAFSNYNGQLFDVGLYRPGSTRAVHFKRPGVVRVFCNIHAAMSAIVLVLETPYFATTTRTGSFEIPDVPPGDYQLMMFHERATEQTLASLARPIVVGREPLVLETIEISESGFLSTPHKNKYGKDYPPPLDENAVYPAVTK